SGCLFHRVTRAKSNYRFVRTDAETIRNPQSAIDLEPKKRERRPLFEFRLIRRDELAVARRHRPDGFRDWPRGTRAIDRRLNIARAQLHDVEPRRRPHASANPLILVHREALLIQRFDPRALRLDDEAHAARDVLEIFRGRGLPM